MVVLWVSVAVLVVGVTAVLRWITWGRNSEEAWAFILTLAQKFLVAARATLKPSKAPRDPVAALDQRVIVQGDGSSRPFILPSTKKEKGYKVNNNNTENETEDEITTRRLQLKIVSYNILAPVYTRRLFFPYTSSNYLSWTYRMPRIVKELELLKADIVCLQEVEGSLYDNFKLKFQRLGYEGVFLQKSRTRMDGVAILYNEKYTLEQVKQIRFNDLALQDSLRAPLVGLIQDTVALIALFKTSANQFIIVANVHIYYLWTRPDIQSVQVGTLLQEIEHFSNQVREDIQDDGHQPPKQIPIVLCGDFNSLPQSPPYQVLCQANDVLDQLVKLPVFANFSQTQTQNDKNNDDRNEKAKKIGKGETDDGGGDVQKRGEKNPYVDRLKHNLRLKSAYKTVLGSEPQWTNYTGDFKGCIDYIWYSEEDWEAVEVLNFADKKTMGEHYGCPDIQFPSDHLSLLTTLQLRPETDH